MFSDSTFAMQWSKAPRIIPMCHPHHVTELSGEGLFCLNLPLRKGISGCGSTKTRQQFSACLQQAGQKGTRAPWKHSRQWHPTPDHCWPVWAASIYRHSQTAQPSASPPLKGEGFSQAEHQSCAPTFNKPLLLFHKIETPTNQCNCANSAFLWTDSQ